MSVKIISNAILRAVAIIFGIVAIFYILYKLQIILVYLILASVISLIGRPLAQFLRHRLRFSNTIAVITVMSFILFFLGGIISLFIPLLITQGQNLATINVDSVYKNIDIISTNFFNIIGLEDVSLDKSYITKIFNLNDVSNLINGLISIVSNFGIGLFSVIFIAFFFLKDGTFISNNLINLVDKRYIPKTRNSIEQIKNLLSRYFVGLIIQLTIIFVILTITLLICGVKDAFIIAFLCSLLNLIPYLGPLIGSVVISILTMSSFIDADFVSVTLPKTIYVMIGFMIAQLIDNFFSQPFIFSNSVKSSPLEIFLIILSSGILFGVVGMVIAVPAYTVIKVILKAIFSDNKIVKLLTRNM